MKTHRRYRTRPSAERALHQVQRGRLPECPRCLHPVIAHALDDGGQRVCTRGVGLVSCRECARVQAVMPEAMRGMFYLAQAFQLAAKAAAWKPLVLSVSPAQAASVRSVSAAAAQSSRSRS